MRTAHWVIVAVATLVVAGVLAVTATTGDAPAPVAGSGTAAPATATPRELTTDEAGQAFLDAYVDPEGRVVRRDQGDDTVSEGQAYALLVAVALDDQDTFNRVWSWTSANLRRPDGTLSWRWQGGQVVDESSASDADLDAARALVLAGRTFSDAQLTTDGNALGAAILDTETVRTELGRILVAGSWATSEPYAYNPSYASPVAYTLLDEASADPRWAELATGSRAVTTAILDQSDLPPDWAQVHRDGQVDPMPGAAGRGNDGVRYSYDATRLPLRYAESCDAADVALAARLAEPLARFAGAPASRDLGGQPLTDISSVVAIAAQAAVSAAAGDDEGARAGLVAADHQQQQGATYYGGAWDALGRLMVTDARLGGCPPVSA